MNRKTAVRNLLAQINDHEKEEIFASIENIEVAPYSGVLKIRFYLSTLARMTATVKADELVFSAEGMPERSVKIADGIAGLRRFMYDLDSLLADGYCQPELKLRVIFFPPPPPEDMDIPVWDEKSQTWHDAEI